MKIRIYPKKDVVLAHFQNMLSNVQKYIDEHSANLAALEERKASVALYNPHLENEIAVERRAISMEKEAEGGILDKIAFLESHDPPEIQVEIDL